MAIVTPLNESNFQRIEPFDLVLKSAEVNSIVFDSATGTFATEQDVIGLVSGGVQQATFTIIYAYQTKTKVKSIAMAV